MGDRGLAMIVVWYYKSFSRTERFKAIDRFLPREVGTLPIYYLWLVLPFWEEVQVNLSDRDNLRAYIWTSEEILARDG